jgi:6-phosphogluconolactonase (cycloisomerase 2 family)
VVPEKGNDQISVLKIDSETGKLEVVSRTPCRENAGPRHFAFHPVLPLAYALNELDSTVTTYDFDDERGVLTARDILSALPRGYVGSSRASEIEISKDGRVLYTSNRGYDSIAIFNIGDDGELSIVGWEPSKGKTPRFFSLDPKENWLYVANEDSDTIIPFRRAADGALSAGAAVIPVGSPTSIVFRYN